MKSFRAIEKISARTKKSENFRGKFVNLTLGSGAIAFILESEKTANKDAPRILGSVGQAYSKAHNLCRGYGDVNHQMIETNASELMEKGLMLAKVTWELFLRNMEWTNETASHIFTHQVSRSHQEKIFSLLKHKLYAQL